VMLDCTLEVRFLGVLGGMVVRGMMGSKVVRYIVRGMRMYFSQDHMCPLAATWDVVPLAEQRTLYLESSSHSRILQTRGSPALGLALANSSPFSSNRIVLCRGHHLDTPHLRSPVVLLAEPLTQYPESSGLSRILQTCGSPTASP